MVTLLRAFTRKVKTMQFQSSFINEILTYIERKSYLSLESPVRLSELASHFAISEHDVRLLCALIQRKRLIKIKVANGDNECFLTQDGKARLAAIRNIRQIRNGAGVRVLMTDS